MPVQVVEVSVAESVCPTLKQTQSENGSVTMTRPQEIAVSSHPQRPMPLSDSSAGREAGERGS